MSLVEPLNRLVSCLDIEEVIDVVIITVLKSGTKVRRYGIPYCGTWNAASYDVGLPLGSIMAAVVGVVSRLTHSAIRESVIPNYVLPGASVGKWLSDLLMVAAAKTLNILWLSAYNICICRRR